MLSAASIRIVTLVVLTSVARALPAQLDGDTDLPRLPEGLDTLTVRYGTTIIGRGIMQWFRQADTHIQVYTWTSVADGSSVTGSLFSDAASLRPQRETRVVGDSTITVLFGPDSISVVTSVASVQRKTQWVRVPATPSHRRRSSRSPPPCRCLRARH